MVREGLVHFCPKHYNLCKNLFYLTNMNRMSYLYVNTMMALVYMFSAGLIVCMKYSFFRHCGL